MGNLLFVPPDERSDRAAALRAAGACAVVDDWWEICELLRVAPVGGVAAR